MEINSSQTTRFQLEHFHCQSLIKDNCEVIVIGIKIVIKPAIISRIKSNTFLRLQRK